MYERGYPCFVEKGRTKVRSKIAGVIDKVFRMSYDTSHIHIMLFNMS